MQDNEIGAGTDPDAIPCDDVCGRQAQLCIVTLADRGVDYVCWPCLLARVVKIGADLAESGPPGDGLYENGPAAA